MTDRKELKIKSGGQWLTSPVNDTKVFCRESFTEDHQDIDAMVLSCTMLYYHHHDYY